MRLGSGNSIMLYMIVEHFKNRDALPVYRRYRERGRLAPEGLTYVSSWVDEELCRCFQLMETDERSLLDEWIANWNDLVDFEVFPVMTSPRGRCKNRPVALIKTLATNSSARRPSFEIPTSRPRWLRSPARRACARIPDSRLRSECNR